MNTYVPYVAGACIIHTLKKKNITVPTIVNENYNH